MKNQKTTDSVTIGITAYNCEATIERAILSAISQDYPNCRILIVDDFSSDKTHDILNLLSSKYASITVLRHRQNAGVAASRNTIIQNSKTDFIAFFDDDDESQKNRVREQLQAILRLEKEEKTSHIICHSARYVEYEQGNKIYQPCLGQAAGKQGISGTGISEAILMGTRNPNLKGACPTCVQMARVSTYKSLNGFDINLTRSEDTDFSIRAAEQNTTFIGLSEPLVLQKMTAGDEKLAELEAKNWRYLVKKHRTIIERKTTLHFAEKWIDIRFNWLSKQTDHTILMILKLFLRYPFQTLKKIWFAAPNFRLNKNMSKFYKSNFFENEK